MVTTIHNHFRLNYPTYQYILGGRCHTARSQFKIFTRYLSPKKRYVEHICFWVISKAFNLKESKIEFKVKHCTKIHCT